MITRRSVLGAAAAAMTVPAIASARADDGQVDTTTWGGDYADLLAANVEKPLLAPKGIEVIHDINSSDARKTKLIAEKMSRHGSMDVVHLSDTDMFQMAKIGVFEDVPPASVPNLAEVLKPLRMPYAIPHIFSAQLLVYNPDKVDQPKSFTDFLDPKYMGRVGIPDLNYSVIVMGMALAAGGSMSNWEPAKKMLMDLKKNQPRLYPSHEDLVQGLKSGEIWLAPEWLAREFMWKKSGVNLARVVPTEGAIPVIFQAAVPKNAQNKANGWAYLNAMLNAKAQLGFADHMGYGPTVTDATLPISLEQGIGFTPAEEAKFKTPDYEYQAAQLPAILDFWNKDFKG
jgi:putative spermidine/putrescine transport system substrate-binding protein